MTDIETKAQSLAKAADQIDEDVWRIEVWTAALLRFASSVPVYEPNIWLDRMGPVRALENTAL
jgi:hypothetical protein